MSNDQAGSAKGASSRMHFTGAGSRIVSISVFSLASLCNVGAAHVPQLFTTSSKVASSSPPSPRTAPPSAHVVKLSWNASAPASKSPRDAIVGYFVYRSTKSHDPNAARITSEKVVSTSYTDSTIQSGKTYYYVTRAVTAGGMLSVPSNELRVLVP
jgi:hypothetical protein